ncbi:Clavaminate synthase-like protein [Hypoxylon fuscum]|nr:Clavaminate synthase-like protein [Hypoxylon fuscum]
MRSRLGFPTCSHLASSNRSLRCVGGLARLQSTSSLSPAPSHDQHLTETKQSSHIKTVEGQIDIDSYRKFASNPLLLKRYHNLPASQKWFRFATKNSYTTFTKYMKAYQDVILSYEFTAPCPSHADESTSEGQVLTEFLNWLRSSSEYQESYLPLLVESIIQSTDISDSPGSTLNFQQFEAPLSLIVAACQFNGTKPNPAEQIKQLYVAQSDLSHLPKHLFQDLHMPDIVKYAGKGDIYGSSIWLGLQPTYTPLHRDPNPNLFCQLVSSKRIRLIAPDRGDEIYARIRRALGSHGNSRFRGAEMMEGRERNLLHHAVWDDDAVDEVSLDPGDALSIPKGWWHSVASNGQDGAINASVNWWFR